MNKKTKCNLIIVAILLVLLPVSEFAILSCSSNEKTRQIADNTNLRIDQDRIFTPVIINAADTLDMLFDTGCMVGCLLPQSLAANYTDTSTVAQSETGVSKIKVKDISLGGQSLNSNNIYQVPGKIEAMIAPVYATEKRIWCFDFDNRIFSICETDTLPENAIVYPLLFAKYGKRKLAPFVNIPMTLSYKDDTLSTDYIYMLDTGTPYGFAITDPTPELEDFVLRIPHWKIEDSMCVKIPDRKLFDFEVNIEMPSTTFPNIRSVFDTGLRSFSGEFKNYLTGIDKPIVGTIGMRLLKHFNMILDLKNDRLILTPARSTYPSKPINRVGFWCNSKGVITRIRTNDTAYGQGLRLGDRIVSVDGILWNDISEKRQNELYSCTEHHVWKIESKEGTKDIVI